MSSILDLGIQKKKVCVVRVPVVGEPLVARDRLLSCGCPGEAAKIGSCRAGAPTAQDAMAGSTSGPAPVTRSIAS